MLRPTQWEPRPERPTTISAPALVLVAGSSVGPSRTSGHVTSEPRPREVGLEPPAPHVAFRTMLIRGPLNACTGSPHSFPRSAT
jgi:hypothetical protein